MEAVRVCPACEHESPATNYRCDECGRSLSGTMPVHPDSLRTPEELAAHEFDSGFEYIDSDGHERRLADISHLARAVHLGQVQADTQVFDAQAGRWVPAGDHYASESMFLQDESESRSKKVFLSRRRIGRLKYFLLSFILNLPLMFGAVLMDDPATEIIGAILSIIGIVMLIPFTFVAVRRLHDLDWSGWLWLILLIPVLNVFLGMVLLFKRGTEGPNKYGPAPPIM